MTGKVQNKAAISIAVMLATIMQVLDTTIANVALPHIQGSISATQDQISWVLTSYIVASAIMTPPTGWLAGRFGLKRIFLISVAGFTAASVLCGLAASIEEMVLFRLLQGLFGAALVPLSQSVLLDINPPEKHGSALALWGIGVMIGPILGPTLGGYLTEYYNWRWVFYINVPVGILAFFGISIFLPETRQSDRPFDRFGFLTLSLAIGALQLMLDRGEQVDWFHSTETLIYCGIIAGALWMFIVHVRQAAHPFFTLSLFRDRNMVTGLIFIFFIGIILLATMALLPPYLQTVMGYPVITVGLTMAPRGFGTMAAMMIVGRLSGKVDPRPLITFGLLLTAFSLWEMTQFSTFVPSHVIIRTGIVQGFGLGFIFVPLSALTFATLPPGHRTEAAGLYNLMRNLGSSVGVSLIMGLLSRNTQINHAYLSENITSFKAGIAQYFMPQGLPGGVTAALAAANGEITRQAATIAFINDFKLMMLLVLCALPLVALLRRPKIHSKESDMPNMIHE